MPYACIAVEWLEHIETFRDLRVFIAICAHADADTSKCYPSKARLAELSGVDVRHVQRSLRNLTTVGAIKLVTMGGQHEERRSCYKVMPPPEAVALTVDAEAAVADLTAVMAEIREHGGTVILGACGGKRIVSYENLPPATSPTYNAKVKALSCRLPASVFRSIVVSSQPPKTKIQKLPKTREAKLG